MIVGNHQTTELVKKIIDRMASPEGMPFHFFLLTGPAHIGKATLVEKCIHQSLGMYATTNFLHYKDLSEIIGKNHSLRVEVDDKEKEIESDDGKKFTNLGTRDMIGWLSLSPIAKYKIVLLENIERMTISASNSLLKTLEETLPNRYIFATSAQIGSVLPTILSRAIVLRMQEVSDGDLQSMLQDHDNKNLHTQMMRLSRGRPGLLQKYKDDPTYLEHIAQIEKFVVPRSASLQEKVSVLMGFHKKNMLEETLDTIIYLYTLDQRFGEIEKIILLKKMIQANVTPEHAMMYAML